MRRCFYFGCRNDKGHYLFSEDDNYGSLKSQYNFGISVSSFDGTFAPIDKNSKEWKLTHLHAPNHHFLSILAKHDFTVDKRPGSNSAFIILDEKVYDQDSILNEMKRRFPDCYSRLVIK